MPLGRPGTTPTAGAVGAAGGEVRLATRSADATGELLVPLASAAAEAAAGPDPVTSALRLAEALGGRLAVPGGGSTARLWEALATLGAVDLTVARVVEPHLDACAILQQAGLERPAGATLGVYAAEAPGQRLEASPRQGGVVLDGTKPWCSLADQVSHALVTAHVEGGRRQLFLVDLVDEGVHRDPESPPWVARGLAAVTSTGLVLEGVAGLPVGGPGWYLERPGFAWGGLGVAAVWFGGAVGVARRVRAALLAREADQVGRMHLGRVDVALSAGRDVLAAAAEAVDDGRARGAVGSRLALRVRSQVADVVEQVLLVADHALGPAPLALEEEHARRVDDLRLYVRQHHAERDLAALGSELLAADRARADEADEVDGADGVDEGWGWW